MEVTPTLSVAVQVMVLEVPAASTSPPSGAFTVTAGAWVSGITMVKSALLASSPLLAAASCATTFTLAVVVAAAGTVQG